MTLDLINLSAGYGDSFVLSEVTLSVRPGEIVGVLGPSGSGKSTLLRAIAGLEPLRSGKVLWNKIDQIDIPVHKRKFGMVFQDAQLFPHADVAGNISFGLRMRKVARAIRNARVNELLDLVGLAGFNNRRISELSGGERQRIALARTLATQPEVLLLDEPLSALDTMFRADLAKRLAEEVRKMRAATIVVTHDHNEIFAITDRVAIVSRGSLLQIGSPKQVWQAPATQEVAQFIGKVHQSER